MGQTDIQTDILWLLDKFAEIAFTLRTHPCIYHGFKRLQVSYGPDSDDNIWNEKKKNSDGIF